MQVIPLFLNAGVKQERAPTTAATPSHPLGELFTAHFIPHMFLRGA